MRMIIALIGLFVLFAGTANAQVSATHICSLQVMEENNLTVAETRNLPVGFTYTHNGVGYVLETYGDTIWNDCRTEILPAVLTATSQAQPTDNRNNALVEEVRALQDELVAAQATIQTQANTIAGLEDRLAQPQEPIVVEVPTIVWWPLAVALLIIIMLIILIFFQEIWRRNDNHAAQKTLTDEKEATKTALAEEREKSLKKAATLREERDTAIEERNEALKRAERTQELERADRRKTKEMERLTDAALKGTGSTFFFQDQVAKNDKIGVTLIYVGRDDQDRPQFGFAHDGRTFTGESWKKILKILTDNQSIKALEMRPGFNAEPLLAERSNAGRRGTEETARAGLERIFTSLPQPQTLYDSEDAERIIPAIPVELHGERRAVS